MSTAEQHTTRTRTHAPRRREHRRTHTAWFFVGALAVWLYFGIVGLHLLHNTVFGQAYILVGAALIPGTIFWIMLHRLRTTDTVTAVRLIFAAVVGGTLAFLVGCTLDSVLAVIPQPQYAGHGLFALTLAGFAEEFAKGALIVIVGWRVAKSTRNGLFIGASVGLGFAILESMAYVSASFVGAEPVVDAGIEAVERSWAAPFAHVLWSALLGAALFTAAAKKGRFRLSWSVLGTYVGVSLLHGIWDSGAGFVVLVTGDPGLGNVASWICVGVGVFVGGLIWRHVARNAPAPSAEGAAAETVASPPPAAAVGG